MVDGLHHYLKRKRIFNKTNTHKFKDLMDKVIYGVGIFGPVVTIPQVMKIWVDKNAAGVSLISWSAYLLGAMFWVTYGILHKEKPIIFAFGSMILLHLAVVVGILFYG